MDYGEDSEYGFAAQYESNDREIDHNTIIFQLENEDGSPKEIIKASEEGFFIYGERLKSADDVAAAFRHFFSQAGYDVDEDGRVVAEMIQGPEDKKD